jgi:hypothetical protein
MLTGPDHWQLEQGGVMVTAVGHDCFFCEKTIETNPAWMWHGASGEVFLRRAPAGCLQGQPPDRQVGVPSPTRDRHAVAL